MKTQARRIVGTLAATFALLMLLLQLRYTIAGSVNAAVPTIMTFNAENINLLSSFTLSKCANAVAVSGIYAYVGECSAECNGQQVEGGLRIFNIADPENPIDAGFFPTGETVSDVEVAGSYAYIVSARSLRIINVADTAHLTQVGFYQGSWDGGAVAVVGSYAYFAEGKRLHIISIANPSSPMQVGSYFAEYAEWIEDVVVAGNYAYVAEAPVWYPPQLAYSYGGLRIINIENPTAPTAVGFYDSPDWPSAVYVRGNYAFVADGFGGLRIINILNPTAPTEVSSYVLPGSPTGMMVGQAVAMAITDNYAYLTEQHIEQLDGESVIKFGLHIIDVTDLKNPTPTDFYDTPGLGWQLAVVGNYVYIANSCSGLIILRWPDFSIAHMEITQAIQNQDNSVPLIAGKPTLVRLYLDCNRGCDAIPSDARLQGFDSSGKPLGTLIPFRGFQPANFRNWEEQHSDLHNTLNYELLPEWLTGTITLRAEVRGVAMSRTITFAPGHKLRVAWVAIPYNPLASPPGTPVPVPPPPIVPDEEVTYKGVRDLLAMYPVALDDVTYVMQPHFDQLMTVPFSCQENSSCPALTHYLNALNTFWYRMSRTGAWVDSMPPDRLYGWIPEEAQSTTQSGTLCGRSDPTWYHGQGRVAAGLESCHDRDYFGNEIAIAGARTFAHEVSHLLNSGGLIHSPSQPPWEDPHCLNAVINPEYPTYVNLPLGSIGEWGVRHESDDGIWRLLDPAQTYDFMSSCSPEWVSLFNYEKLISGFEPPPAADTGPRIASIQRSYLASGIVFSPALTATLNPLFVLTSTVSPGPNLGGAYCLELRDGSESLLDARCFDLTFIDLETNNPIAEDGFVLVLPYPDGAQAMVLTHNDIELARLAASLSAPQVEVLTPKEGEAWQRGEIHTIVWKGSDPDGEVLHYAISYSTDGGVSWNPVVLDTTETHWTVDADRFPGSANAKMKVEVSDGFNTGANVSDTFSVERKGPHVVILSPGSDGTIPPGTPLWLQGYAYDLEDGTLNSSVLSWTSSLDGDLGVANHVLVTLSEGEHIITLTAVDSDGNTAVDSVDIDVGSKVYLPIILR